MLLPIRRIRPCAAATTALAISVTSWTLALLFPICASGEPPEPARLEAEADRILVEYTAPGSPGCSVVVVSEGKPVFRKG